MVSAIKYLNKSYCIHWCSQLHIKNFSNKVTDERLEHVYVDVQFYLWFKIFKASIIWIYQNVNQREKDQTALKIPTKDKVEPQHIYVLSNIKECPYHLSYEIA